MACLHIKNYSKFKDYIHPNIKHTINHYKKGYYNLPTYHGCGLKNRNYNRKRVDYKRVKKVITNAKSFMEKNKKQVQTISF